MSGKRIRSWLETYFWKKYLGKKQQGEDCGAGEDFAAESRPEPKHAFSPMSYQNPCIDYIHPILERVLEKRNIPYQHLKLAVIDVETEQDDYDIQTVLSQLGSMLNYLLLVTDRPDYFSRFMDKKLAEDGLIVQQTAKAGGKGVYGNMILDFERRGNVPLKGMLRPDVIYIPVYKKPWEICENLDIRVPVGYNTLVVDGIYLPKPDNEGAAWEGFFESHLDRLDKEFRKG